MRKFILVVAGILAVAFVFGAGFVAAQQQAALSPWAYGFATPPGPAGAPAAPAPAAPAAARGGGGQPAAPDTTQHQVPGSTLSFTLAQVRDTYGPADWFPGDHPSMPDIVAH